MAAAARNGAASEASQKAFIHSFPLCCAVRAHVGHRELFERMARLAVRVPGPEG